MKGGGPSHGLAMFVDELQYVKENELAALITALHRASQRHPKRSTCERWPN
jgi:hypothetical protein